MRSCLITGGFGFLGRNLLKHFRGLTDRIAVCEPEGNEQLIREYDVTYYNTDLLSPGETKALIGKEEPEVILHLASTVTSERDFGRTRPFIENNVFPLLKLLAASEESPRLRTLVNFGSLEEYGETPLPYQEDSRENPQSPYALSKVFATHLAEAYARQKKVPVVTLRPSLVYGPHQKPDKFIPNAILRAIRGETIIMTPGEQKRDLLFVGDLADIVEVICRRTPDVYGTIYNVASGTTVTMSSLVELILKLTRSGSRVERTLPYRREEAMDHTSDTSRITSLLGTGFPWTPLEEGLRATIRSYEEQ